MSSWIKIDAGVIVKYSDGPHNLPVADGWRQVAYPAKQWKLAVDGRVIKKSQANLDADAAPKIAGEIEDRQRIGGKVQSVIDEFKVGNDIPLRNFLTRMVMKFRELEDQL